MSITMDMIKNKKRVREIGEVFTPPNIVNEMITTVPDKEWKDSSFTILEPTCGNGNFLVIIVNKKIKYGLTPIQALNTTFGTDICPENIDEARHRLLDLVINLGIKMSDKRTAVCIIHHNIFVVNDFLKTTAAIQNRPFFVKTKGITRSVLNKSDKETMKSMVKNIKIDNNFNFVKKLGDNSVFKKYDDSNRSVFDFF